MVTRPSVRRTVPQRTLQRRTTETRQATGQAKAPSLQERLKILRSKAQYVNFLKGQITAFSKGFSNVNSFIS